MDSDEPVLVVRPEAVNPEFKAAATRCGFDVVASNVLPKGKAVLYYPASRRNKERHVLLLRLIRGDVPGFPEDNPARRYS